MTNARIDIEQVKVIRQGRAILDVDQLAVGSAEILAVVGPNGAGKSTLVQVMGLLLTPDQGRVRVAGQAVTRKNAYTLRQKIACVFQSPHLLDRSVRANVELGMRLRKLPVREREQRADHWLSALGLAHLARRKARTLSGGEAQRVNLARALALNPEVLLLDEPLGGLDAPTRHSLMEEIGPLVRQGAGAGLLVTHDRRVALALGDRVAVMLDGQVRQVGPPQDVFAQPLDEQVARFVGTENLVPAEAVGEELRLPSGEVLHRQSGAPDGPVVLCLRAEEVRIEPNPTAPQEPNALRGTVSRIMPRGVGFAAEIDVGFPLISRLTRADLSVLDLQPGQGVVVRIRPEGLHCIPREK